MPPSSGIGTTPVESLAPDQNSTAQVLLQELINARIGKGDDAPRVAVRAQPSRMEHQTVQEQDVSSGCRDGHPLIHQVSVDVVFVHPRSAIVRSSDESKELASGNNPGRRLGLVTVVQVDDHRNNVSRPLQDVAVESGAIGGLHRDSGVIVPVSDEVDVRPQERFQGIDDRGRGELLEQGRVSGGQVGNPHHPARGRALAWSTSSLKEIVDDLTKPQEAFLGYGVPNPKVTGMPEEPHLLRAKRAWNGIRMHPGDNH